ncbi:hypothetical protein Dda_1944 [Drechslerella dactyloides]|uniref:DNA recombination and repair protein Rad51-like C-terminal domain-containing protein n=1 Tax=Drechslerella dactyloides TaxID=74499 RepID=A0AAD6NL23_DREDA|nr:hypothetical protein Dda_1944 [Drechslerella dactyloides]
MMRQTECQDPPADTSTTIIITTCYKYIYRTVHSGFTITRPQSSSSSTRSSRSARSARRRSRSAAFWRWRSARCRTSSIDRRRDSPPSPHAIPSPVASTISPDEAVDGRWTYLQNRRSISQQLTAASPKPRPVPSATRTTWQSYCIIRSSGHSRCILSTDIGGSIALPPFRLPYGVVVAVVFVEVQLRCREQIERQRHCLATMAAGGGGLARRLLMQVEQHGETLTDLLADVRLAAQHHSPAGPLRVPAIDALLHPHLHDHLHNHALPGNTGGSGGGGAGTLGSTASDSLFDDVNVPRDRPAIVEISADRPRAGKTHLLYHLAGLAVLPSSWNGVTLAGQDGAVVFIDCDGRFDVLRLAATIEAYVRTRLARAVQFCRSAAAETDHSDPALDNYLALLLAITDAHVAELVEYVLAHVHVYSPQSSPQLLDILSAIPAHITASPSHNRPLSSILIDGVSAFYWLDRQSSLPPPPSSPLPASNTPPPLLQPPLKPSNSPSQLQSRYEALTSTLRAFSIRFGATVVLTNTFVATAATAAAPSSTMSNHPPFPRHLPACYTYSSKFLTARIILTRDIVAPFRLGIQLPNAHAEREARSEAVRRAGVSGWVGGAGRAVDGGTVGGGWFWFQIADGVQIDDEQHDDADDDDGDDAYDGVDADVEHPL